MSISANVPDERVADVKLTSNSLVVSLKDGRIISVPLAWYPRLLNASKAQRKNWQISGGGYGIHWPDIDEDLSTEGLLRGAPAPRRLIDSSTSVANRMRFLAQRNIENYREHDEVANSLSEKARHVVKAYAKEHEISEEEARLEVTEAGAVLLDSLGVDFDWRQGSEEKGERRA
jgi:Protein of unknown function (DUF2442)